ncbi:hypothetical protein RJ55_06329 [Drechmeria coniospora]|nr:hypothetical protein RJ55_06329 [Drechmeria coniospora]
MSSLPSYREATTRPDWLLLAAPRVRFADYRSLCLVCRRSWSIFAPRLWGDLLRSVRRSGLEPADDLVWWLDFVSSKLVHVDPKTRALVRVLDATCFAKDAYYHYASDRSSGALEQAFVRALELLPNADSLLLDGHADLNPGFLLLRSPLATPSHRLRLLSLARCAAHLPSAFFHAPCLQKLVYLDVSDVPGSVAPLLEPALLPDLCILKLQGRAVDDAALGLVVRTFSRRLWSLDLTGNPITDAAVQLLGDWSFSPASLRSGDHFEAEGQVAAPRPHGTAQHGPFLTIEESALSGAFCHPERHLVDAPRYAGAAPESAPHHGRSDASSPIRDDSAESSSRLLSRAETDLEREAFCTSRGLTHLRLSGTNVTSAGIQKLLRISSGRLEDLACDLPPLCPSVRHRIKSWPDGAKLYGILGAAHLFRPVVSSNLRKLRIHHSLVTHIPTLEAESLSAMARLFLAETSILERVERAYPRVFVPDMNPRLTSLTLTNLPRRSSGPLIEKLVDFINLLSLQERTIRDAATAASSWRSPRLLPGLRRLTLEFASDPMQDGRSTSDFVDAEELMSGAESEFSFFPGEQGGRRRPEAHGRARPDSDVETRTEDPPRSDRDSCHRFEPYHGTWNGKAFSVPVWIGTDGASNDVLDRYRRLVIDDGLRDGVGPATPCQVAAGAPERSYIFQDAWCAAVMPPRLQVPPRSALEGMRDVLDELRLFRLAGRAASSTLRMNARDGRPLPGEPPRFWTGTLKVSTP